ncbi:hypothetical protein JSY36_10635 [Bacillus sp. H-16]|uniref:hypothetical protein n=1 Tax=Alteribacter salitolerans TaxID=2912333 RepID=UPI0019639DDE|nr:hypothetical protein [Alteribacter salitolerans]MBM7096213.1 hypothetical protein [Alteribacter salitolerans]
MRKIKNKKQSALRNLELAAERIDPYMNAIREAATKTSPDGCHYLQDLKRLKWKKALDLFKTFWSFKSIFWSFPAGVITWFFTMDVIWGFSVLTSGLLLIILIIANYVLREKTIQEMTNVKKKDTFHYYAFTNFHREYDLFSPFLIKGNDFKFKQATDLIREWEKDMGKKDEMILKLEEDLRQLASDAVNLPEKAKQEVAFVNTIYVNLINKIEYKARGSLTFETMDFFGHYAIYRLDGERLILEHSSRSNVNIPQEVDLTRDDCSFMSYVKILRSSYSWEADRKSTISFIVEIKKGIYVYTVLIDSRNRNVLNPETETGKHSIEKMADLVSTGFKLYAINVTAN